MPYSNYRNLEKRIKTQQQQTPGKVKPVEL